MRSQAAYSMHGWHRDRRHHCGHAAGSGGRRWNSLEVYLARVAEEKQCERALAKGAETFRRVISDPETVAAFDAEYGGPAQAKHTPQAA